MKKYIKLLIFCVFIALFIYFGTLGKTSESKKKNPNNNSVDKYFGSAYVFEEINHSKLLSKLNSNDPTMIIYACFKDSDLCDSYAQLINEIARNYEIDEILYYDFKIDKKEKNATYQKIVDKLSDYLLTNDLGEQDLYSPTLLFIKNGSVFAIDDDLAFNRGKVDAQDVLTEEFKSEKTGIHIAESRARIKMLQHIKNNELKPELSGLKQLYYSMNKSRHYNRKSYEAKMLWKQMKVKQRDIDLVTNIIHNEKQKLNDYISDKNEFYKKVSTNRAKKG